MKTKTKKYAFTKIKSIPTESGTIIGITSQGLTDETKRTDFEVSFDSFFYQDHVTLKKYSMDHLRHSSGTKNQCNTEFVNQKWREQQQSQMVKLIDYIDLWKHIKSNRNNILVYGNKKNYPELLSTQKKILCNTDKDEEKSVIDSTTFGTERANTTENPFISNRPSHLEANKQLSEKKYPFKSKQKEPPSIIQSQGIGKLKRKMNLQIYKLNKELLRDYLNSNKQYHSIFNYLIKDQDKLQSKLLKITTLIQLLKKQNSLNTNDINSLPQNPLKNLQNPNSQKLQSQRIISKSYQPKSSQTLRIKTQISQFEQSDLTRDVISFKKLKSTCKKQLNSTFQQIKRQETSRQKKHFNTPLILKNKLNTCLYKRNQENSKIQKAFDKEWENINEQIRLKFRREAEYSLNMEKRK